MNVFVVYVPQIILSPLLMSAY